MKSPGACGRGYCRRRRSELRDSDVFRRTARRAFRLQGKICPQYAGQTRRRRLRQKRQSRFCFDFGNARTAYRREKATSNICTNQGLIALAATIYMEAMGKKGLQEVAVQNAQKAAYAAKKISEIEGFSIPFSAPKFNEFVVRAPKSAEEILEKLSHRKRYYRRFGLVAILFGKSERFSRLRDGNEYETAD